MTKEEMLRLLTAAYTAPARRRGHLCRRRAPCLRRWNGAALEHGDRRTGTAGLCVLRCGGVAHRRVRRPGVRPQRGGDGRRTARPDAGGTGRNARLRQRRPLRRVVRTGGGHPPGEGAAAGKRKRHRGHRGGGAGRGKPPARPPSGRPRPSWTGSGPWARTQRVIAPLRRR